jgi:hypothetical protein
MWKFNGLSSNDMGVIASELDFTAKAPQRVDRVIVDGKNESQFVPLGYSEVDIDIFLQLVDVAKENEVYSWLNGEGILEFNGKVSKAYFYDSFQFKRDASIKTSRVRLLRSPFWHKAIDEFTNVTTSVINVGTIPSQPLIRFEKNTSSTFDVTIGGVRFNYDFADDTSVEIDCATGEVKFDSLYRFNQIDIGYDLPILAIGSSVVSIHSGDPIVKIKRKDRWL